MDYPDTHELCAVYDDLLEAVFNSKEIPEKWRRSSERQKLSRMIVDLYNQTRSKFTVDDHRHYLFTPRDLTSLVRGLLR